MKYCLYARYYWCEIFILCKIEDINRWPQVICNFLLMWLLLLIDVWYLVIIFNKWNKIFFIICEVILFEFIKEQHFYWQMHDFTIFINIWIVKIFLYKVFNMFGLFFQFYLIFTFMIVFIYFTIDVISLITTFFIFLLYYFNETN